jgi:small basic protein (TIGR04137 family)
MSLDRSLRTGGNLSQHRNVLKRNERIDRLKETTGYSPDKKSVLGLQKTANRKTKVGA